MLILSTNFLNSKYQLSRGVKAGANSGCGGEGLTAGLDLIGLLQP